MTRDERRSAMPFCADAIDWHRKNFGEPFGDPEKTYVKAQENGHEIEWGVNPIVGVGVIPVLK